MQEVLNAASFDAVYVQFCKGGTVSFLELLIGSKWRQQLLRAAEFQYSVGEYLFLIWYVQVHIGAGLEFRHLVNQIEFWISYILMSSICRDNWARTISPNKNVKIYIGAPASSTAAGGGFVSAGTLGSIAKQMRNSFPSFGGVMLWDASQAFSMFWFKILDDSLMSLQTMVAMTPQSNHHWRPQEELVLHSPLAQMFQHTPLEYNIRAGAKSPSKGIYFHLSNNLWANTAAAGTFG